MTLFVKRLIVILMTVVVVSCSLALDTSALNQGCPEGTKACFGQCVSMRLAKYGCARPGCAPCALQHATSNCNDSYECSIASCAPPFNNCDSDPTTGCETNTDESTQYCGGCAAVNNCTSQAQQIGHHITAALCGAGACYISQCDPGYLDCDGQFATGCEYPSAQLQSDVKNCGACNVVCAANQSCVNGVCQ